MSPQPRNDAPLTADIHTRRCHTGGSATVPAMVRTESACEKLPMWRTRDPALLLQEPHLHIREARHKALPLHQSLESESHLRFRVTLALVQDVKAKHPHDPRQGGRRFREGCKDLDDSLLRFGHPESIRSTRMCQPTR